MITLLGRFGVFFFLVSITAFMSAASPVFADDSSYDEVFAEAVEKFGDDRPIDLQAAEDFLMERERAVFAEELSELDPDFSNDSDFTMPDFAMPNFWDILSGGSDGVKELGAPLPSPSLDRGQFCVAARDLDYFRNLIGHRNNQLSMWNRGGLFGGGVCWWHSRLQRSATYLSVYRPDLPQPDKGQVKDILTRLIAKSRVVEIPGFNNLREFSEAWTPLIQDRLERWQAIDGFLWQAWIRGLAGATEVSAKRLRKKMDELYRETEEKKRISYVKLQVPGIAAHAWLIAGMTRLSDGYQLKVIDSNMPGQLVSVDYKDGSTSLSRFYGKYVPYLERTSDFSDMERAIKKYCR